MGLMVYQHLFFKIVFTLCCTLLMRASFPTIHNCFQNSSSKYYFIYGMHTVDLFLSLVFIWSSWEMLKTKFLANSIDSNGIGLHSISLTDLATGFDTKDGHIFIEQAKFIVRVIANTLNWFKSYFSNICWISGQENEHLNVDFVVAEGFFC